jgi:uncharacterized membrane-anchored protein
MIMNEYEPLADAHPLLPPDDAWRRVLHDEVHARPSAQVGFPARVVYLAVDNAGVSREEECAHLQCLPGQSGLKVADLQGNFLRMALPGATLKWERHTEFTRYSLVLPVGPGGPAGFVGLLGVPEGCVPPSWWSGVPGRTFCAIELVVLPADLGDTEACVQAAQDWFVQGEVMVSRLGSQAHALAMTDFRLHESGFEHMLVFTTPQTSEVRAGRMVQRLLELETYRLMALRGLPVAKGLSAELSEAETQLARITSDMECNTASDQAMLDTLVSLAARVEKAIAQHQYRFSATRAYDTLVAQRIAELRETPIEGMQTIGAFMRRRLSPAMATVMSTAQRLTSLSERVSRASALLRTRVDIATEGQNQQLLEQLTRGQTLQLRLQSTVEGLSIAAISYYVISLLLYGAKALKSVGVPIHPEMATGALIPVVLYGVWYTTRRIHQKLHAATH